MVIFSVVSVLIKILCKLSGKRESGKGSAKFKSKVGNSTGIFSQLDYLQEQIMIGLINIGTSTAKLGQDDKQARALLKTVLTPIV